MRGLWHRFRAVFKTPATRQCRRSFNLNVESLEDRRVLSTNPGLASLPNVTYHGGPLLQNVQLESVYYGQPWSATPSVQQLVPQVDGFLQYFPTSPYMDVLSQYNVGHGSFLNKDDIIAQNPTNGTIDDSQIRQILNTEISTGKLASPTANAGGQLYLFFTAPGVVVTAGGQSSTNDFAGYHDTFTDTAGAAVYYAVIPYPTGGIASIPLTDFQQMTVALSHEIAEGVTDPDTQTGWFDQRQNEIGDLGGGQVGNLHGYEVQAVWSQAAHQAVIPTDTTGTSLQVTGDPVQAIAGQAFTSIVATITGAAPGSTTTSFTASIDWGNGNTTDGTITNDAGGGFDVSGTNTYAQAGFATITATVHDQTGAVVGSATTSAHVTSPVPVTPPTFILDARGTELTATAGQPFSGVVASFTDSSAGATAGQFTATIDWGDGTTSPGTITANTSGGFDVSGTHTYAVSSATGPGLPPGGWGFVWTGPGIYGNEYYVVATTIHDTASTASAIALSLAKVAPVPPSITANGQNIQATSGQPFSGTVATFTDVIAGAALGDFTATIDWGDGTSSAGTIAANASGGFDVSASHTYSTDTSWYGFGDGYGLGSRHFVIHTTIADTITHDRAIAESLATVAPAPPNISLNGQNIQATSGQQFSGVVATFTDVSPGAAATDFTANIDWGDGTTSAGTITSDPKGGFDVSGTHTYTTDYNPVPLWTGPGWGQGSQGSENFRLTILVQSKTSTDFAVARALATVAPAPVNLQAAGTLINAVFGTPFTGTVATFTTLDTSPTASIFTATIDWGDGTTSTGAIVADPKGGFDVTGTHTFTDSSGVNGWGFPTGEHHGPGGEHYYVRVTIQDTTNNNTALAVSLASVAPSPPKIVATGQTLSLSAGQSFVGAVASFTDADGAGALNFQATIYWGDGTDTTANIGLSDNNTFSVLGTHTYTNGGTYKIDVRIRDLDGDSATALSLAQVTEAIAPPTLATVAGALAQSAEYLSQIVAKDYQQYLGRSASASEIAYWVNAMQHGVTDEQVQAGFVGSPEYYHHAGNTDKAWVDAMYLNLLGRNSDAGGEIAWTHALAAGVSRAAVAFGFAASPEREGIVVQDDYQQYLGRAPSAAEIAGWVHGFKAGVTNEQIIAGFVGSLEYFQMHNGNASDWLTSAYQNILTRAPDSTGYNSWLRVLE